MQMYQKFFHPLGTINLELISKNDAYLRFWFLSLFTSYPEWSARCSEFNFGDVLILNAAFKWWHLSRLHSKSKVLVFCPYTSQFLIVWIFVQLWFTCDFFAFKYYSQISTMILWFLFYLFDFVIFSFLVWTFFPPKMIVY